MVARGRSATDVPGSEVTVRLVSAFHDIIRSSLHRLHPILKEHGITMGQFLTLHVVSTLKVASVGEVAVRLGVSASAVCVSVDQLEGAGLVRRQRSARDGRTVELTVTPRGQKVQARVWRRATHVMSDTVRDLPPADVVTALTVFEHITRRLEPEGAAHGAEAP